jgi:hypothetical protein
MEITFLNHAVHSGARRKTMNLAPVSQKAILVVVALFRWPRFSVAETDASDHASAACYRFPENIEIVAALDCLSVNRADDVFASGMAQSAGRGIRVPSQ